MLSRLLRRWHTFWLEPVPPHDLAFVRIGIGLYLFIYALPYAPYTDMLFSSAGVPMPLYEGLAEGWWSVFLAPPAPWVVRAVYGCTLLCIAGVLTGAFFRVSLISLILSALWFWQLQLHVFPGSFNRILFFCLLVLLLPGPAETFSVDAWRRYGSVSAWRPVPALPRRLIALQITFTFLGVGWQKLWLPMWQSGEILAYSFIGYWATPPARFIARLPLTLQFYDALLWVVKLFEFVLPFGFWIPFLRNAAVAGMSVFLILIASFLGIWWFLFLLPCGVLFYDPVQVKNSLCALAGSRTQTSKMNNKMQSEYI